MSAVVRQEILFFAASLLTGIGLMWLYDLFRILRKLVPHGVLAVSVEDLFYWLVVSLIIFGMIFRENDGILRGHAFVGIIAGAWIQWGMESFSRKIGTKMLKKLRKKGRMKETEEKGK